MLVLVALGVVEQDAGGQAEDTDQFQERETTSAFLCAGLGIGALVFGGVWRADGGAINDFDTEATPELSGFLCIRGGGAAQAWQQFPR